MQLCPQCGHVNDERAKFCSECGGKVPSVVAIQPIPRTTAIQPEPMDRLDAPMPVKTLSEFEEPELHDRIHLEFDEKEPFSGTVFEGAPPKRPEPVITASAPVPPPPPTRPASPSAPTPKLQVIRGERVDVEYPIYPGKNYIGRTDDKPVDIDLEDQERADKIWSSRQHAIIHYENGVLMIEDLNSLNGTFVNRVRLLPGQTRTIRENDVVQVGTVHMKVVIA